MFLATFVSAGELSDDSLTGKWMFTHMILDGGNPRTVNKLVEFRSDGEIIYYDAAGNEQSRASYSVMPGSITYIDQRGKQTWKLIEYGGDSLHVDHRGAEMFFKRQ